MGKLISADDLKEWINDNERQLSDDTDRKFGIFTEDIMKAIDEMEPANQWTIFTG